MIATLKTCARIVLAPAHPRHTLLIAHHRHWPRHASADCWRGGQGTEPYEQNTQQSPGFARSSAPQVGQFQKYRQASVGIRSGCAWPQ